MVGENFTKFGSSIFTEAKFPFATIEMPIDTAPTYTDATFESGYDWKLAFEIPVEKFGEGWTANAEYTALADITDVESKANYAAVNALTREDGKRLTLRGAWCNKWVLTYARKKSGFVIICR